ncbi:MAG: 50S ribosome-binding GTPase, partial [Erysipelotrichaceae bacterium]|nr:50S ribosome-binding GTPase [Erysipelotrichaceae bacterium]
MQRLVVALVGTPNVGKSTIFNRIIGERKAIIDDTRGVTRDRIYGTASWLTKTFGVIDTGGIEIKNVPFQTEIRLQAEIAINEADVIVFLTDAKLGVTNDDIFIAKMLQKSKKKVILAVNKVDDFSLISRVNDFYELGFGTPLPLSGVHGTGIGDLLDQIVAFIKEDYLEEAAVSEATIALIGQVNVGKSSLVNAMLNEERVVVSPVAGTTRDSIDTTF